MSKAARTLAAGVAVAALALTGCTQPPYAAGTVEGVPVPDEAVQRAGKALVDAAALGSATAYKQAAFDLLLGEASRQIAADHGHQISEAEKQQLIRGDQTVGSIMGNPDAWAWGDAVATTYMVSRELGQERFVEELKGLDIEVNPLYGSWDPSVGTMVDSALSASAGDRAAIAP